MIFGIKGVPIAKVLAPRCLNCLEKRLSIGKKFCGTEHALRGVGVFWSSNAIGKILYTTSENFQIMIFDDFLTSIWHW